MIIGNGLLAQAFKLGFGDDNRALIFASGVSNSKTAKESEFMREKELLSKHLKGDRLFVYFSSCSIYDPHQKNTSYTLHKLRMEDLARTSKNYAIFRLPQIVSHSDNCSTLTNFIYRKISAKESFSVWENAKRNIIDIDDCKKVVFHVVTKILQNKNNNLEFNAASPNMTSVIDLVNIFEKVLGIAACAETKSIGNSYSIRTDITDDLAKKLTIDFNANYEERIIRKYYGK